MINYQWYSNTAQSNTGGIAISGATSASYTPPSDVVGTTYYYCIATIGDCSTTSNVSGARTVSSAPTITSQSTDGQTVCINAGFAPISVTASGTGLTYAWYSNTISSNAGGTLLAGTNSPSYTPSSATANTRYYYSVVSWTTNACTTTSAVSGAFVVNNTPTITTQPAGGNLNFICKDSATPLTVVATGTTLTYQWYSNTANSNAGGTIVSGSTSATFTDFIANGTNYYYYCVVSGCGGTITSTQSGRRNVSFSNPQITVTATNNTKCIAPGNGTVSAAVTADASNNLTTHTYTYAWASGQATTSITGQSAGSYSVIVTNTTGGRNCASVSTSATVSDALTYPTLTTSTTSSTNCAGGTANGSVTVSVSGGNAGHTFAWYAGATATGTVLSSAATATALQGSAAGTDYTVLVTNSASGCNSTSTASLGDAKSNPVVVVTPTAANTKCVAPYTGALSASVTTDANNLAGDTYTYSWPGGVTTAAASALDNGTYSVTVTNARTNCQSSQSGTVANGRSNPVITTSQTASTNCSGTGDGSVSANVSGSTTGHTFAWYSGASVSGSALTASTTATDYTASGLQGQSAPGAPFTVRVTNSTSSCFTDQTVYLLSSIVTPTVSTPAAQSGVCQYVTPEALTVSASLSNGSITGYAWYDASAPAVVLGTNSTYTPATSSVGTVNYYVTVTGSNGCTATSGNASVAVVDSPESATISGSPSFCSGLSGSFNVTFSGGQNGPYNITYRDDSDNSSTTVTGYSAGSSVTLSPASSRTYTLTAATANGCPAQTLSGTASFTVNNGPTASVLTGNTVVCEGSNPSLTVTMTGGTGAFTVVLSDGSSNITQNSVVSGTPFNVAANGPKVYTISSVTDANSCSGSGNSGSVSVSYTSATTWQGAASGGDWASAGNWTCGVPSSSFDALIGSGNVVGVSTAVTVRSLTISGSLLFNSGGSMTIYGDLISSGAAHAPAGGYPGCITMAANASPTLTFAGSGNQNISGAGTIVLNDLQISNTAGTVSNNATLIDLYGALTLPLATSVFDADGSGSGVLRLRSTSASVAARIGTLSTPGNFTGKVTVQRHIGNPLINKYRYVSVPLTGFTLLPELSEWNSKSSVYRYNEATTGVFSNGWVKIPTTYSFGLSQRGLGYQAWNTPGLWEARGDLVTGAFNMPVTYTNNGNTDADGWNMVGNPYPSGIGWSSTGWTRSNIGATIYVPDVAANVWRTWNHSSGTGDLSGGVIPIGQGFWVYATGSSPVLGISEAVKVSGAGQYIREAKPNVPVIEISLSRNGVTDNAYLALHPKATSAFDPSFDGLKLEGADLSVSTFSSDGRKLVHGFVSRMDRDIPLHVGASESGEYRISLNFSGDESQWGEVYLIDRLTGESHLMAGGTSVSIMLNDEERSRVNRFFLSTRGASVKELRPAMNVYPNPSSGFVNIQISSLSDMPVRLLSSSGRQIRQLQLLSVDGLAVGELDLSDLPAGIYYLEYHSKGYRSVERIVKR